MGSYHNELIGRLKKETYWCGSSSPYSREIHPLICDEAASAIGELLNSLKAAEADNKRWKQICETQNERIDELEKRAERAEKEKEAVIAEFNKALAHDELCPLQCEFCEWEDSCDGTRVPIYKGSTLKGDNKRE